MPPDPLDYRPFHPPDPYAPAAAGTVGMWLFLAALFMLFASGLIGYVIIRELGAKSPAPGWLRLPQILWLSTALVVGVSVSLGRALHFLRWERQDSFRAWLYAGFCMATGFVLIQGPALAILLASHVRARRAGLYLYGLVFTLVLLHALHVVGGIVALVRVAVKGRRGDYDHEHYLPVRHATMYWHFLDAVWLIMFATFLVTG